MNCNKCIELISAYVDGELLDEERQTVASHLDSCPKCRQQLEMVRSAISLVRGLETLELPPELAQSLRNITPENRTRGAAKAKRPWFLMPTFRVLVAAGAVAMIALTFGISQLLTSTRNAPEIEQIANQQLKSADSRTGSIEYDLKAQSAPEAAYSGTESAATQPSLKLGSKSANDSAVNETERSFPIVKASTTNYDRAAAIALLNDIKAQSDNLYTIGDANAQKSAVIKEIEQKITKRGGKGQLLRAPLEALLKETKRAAIPIYLEKAKYNGKDVWLIIIRWGLGGAKSPLSKASLYITDLSGWKTIDYMSS